MRRRPIRPSSTSARPYWEGSFIGFLIWRILKDVLTGPRITQERVFGSVCAYLLIGYFFAEIYGFIVIVDNQAFAVSEGIRARWTQGDATGLGEVLTYFSFVTMTTLGFGDISPVSPAARTVVWTQALIGQLYLAIMIAGLVGIHIARGRKARSKNIAAHQGCVGRSGIELRRREECKDRSEVN